MQFVLCFEKITDYYVNIDGDHLYGWSPEYLQNRGGYGCDKESGTSGRYSAGNY